MNDQSKRYSRLSILALTVFMLLVILQVNWLIKAANSRVQTIQKNLDLIAPDVALKVNAIDHDAFHINKDSMHLIPDSIINFVVHQALIENGIEEDIVYAIYEDSLKRIYKTNGWQYEQQLIASEAKACISCIVSFSTVSPKDTNDLFSRKKISSTELKKVSTFQYYRPIIGGAKGGSELQFSLYYPNVQSHVLKSMSSLFLVSLFLLLSLLALFYYLLKSLSRHKELSRVKEDFFNNMTHEFKTPLSSIRLASRMLNNRVSPQKQTEYLELIEQESITLETQIDKLLELSLIDNQLSELNKEELDLNDLLSKIPNRLNPLIERKKAILQLQLPDQAVHLSGDSYHLLNAFSNLVENSLKYGQEGVQIKITAHQDEQATVITITDNGPGIDKVHQAHIFERFYRGQSNNQYKGAGFGIGLSYVKAIIEGHDGSIMLDDNHQAGTSFKIKF